MTKSERRKAHTIQLTLKLIIAIPGQDPTICKDISIAQNFRSGGISDLMQFQKKVTACQLFRQIGEDTSSWHLQGSPIIRKHYLMQKQYKDKMQAYRMPKTGHYIDKSSPSSILNLPGSLNLKAGFSFGYRQEVKVIETSPGPIYKVLTQEEKERSLKKYFLCY